MEKPKSREINLQSLTNLLSQDIIQYSIKPYYNLKLHQLMEDLKEEDIPEDVINQYVRKISPSEMKSLDSKDLLTMGIYYNTLHDILKDADLPNKTKQQILQNTPLNQLEYYVNVLGALMQYDYNNEKELMEQLERLQESIDNGHIDEIGTNEYINNMMELLTTEDMESYDFEFKSKRKRRSRKKSKRRRSKKKSKKKSKRRSKRRSRKKSKRRSRKKSKRRSKSRSTSKFRMKSKSVMNKQSSAYKKSKRMADQKFGEKTSAYKSMYIVRMYKKYGGKFSKSRDANRGLTRWNREKWIRINPNTGSPLRRNGKLVSCGRSQTEMKNNERKGLCRPYKRISKNTPKTAKQLGKTEMKRRSRIKTKYPNKYVSSFNFDKKTLKCNSPVKSSKPHKKRMVRACSNGKEKLIHYGATGYGHNYSPKARKSFRARHKCDEAKDKLTANYWACEDLWAGKGGSVQKCPSNRRCKY